LVPNEEEGLGLYWEWSNARAHLELAVDESTDKLKFLHLKDLFKKPSAGK
jgi:hypothetical protein